MSRTSRSQILAAEFTPRKETTEIPKETRRQNSLSDLHHSSMRHAAVVAEIRSAHGRLVGDQRVRVSSLPKVSVDDLERAVSRFLAEVRFARGVPAGGTSSTRQGTSLATKGSGRSTREQREAEDQARVKRNRHRRELAAMKKHHG